MEPFQVDPIPLVDDPALQAAEAHRQTTQPELTLFRSSPYEARDVDNLLSFSYVQQPAIYLANSGMRVFISDAMHHVLQRRGQLNPAEGIAAVARLAAEEDGTKIIRLINQVYAAPGTSQHERLEEELTQILAAYNSTLPRRHN